MSKFHQINFSLKKNKQNYVILHKSERKDAFKYLFLFFFQSVFLDNALWTRLYSHLHVCQSGLSQKSMILQNSKSRVRKASRPVYLFIYATKNC